LTACLLAAFSSLTGKQVDPVVLPGAGSSLDYVSDARGNRLPDFSHAGYRGGGVPVPQVDAVITVAPAEGDDGARIQAAIDHVSGLPLSPEGHRGAVLLQPGQYEVASSLEIHASGVVLRGSGSGVGGTTIVATGTGRRTLIRIEGHPSEPVSGGELAVTSDIAPVGSYRVDVSEAGDLKAGDRIRIHRPATPEWIEAVGMHDAPARTYYKWRPGQWDMTWDRTVREIDGTVLVLDAPLTTALEARFGGARIRKLDRSGPLSECGIEHLRLVSEVSPENPHDEEHSWIAVQLDNVENAWVVDLVGEQFVSSLVDLRKGARAVTVMDCHLRSPVSELAGYRRLSFHTAGELTLFLRCTAREGRHDFTAGDLTTGPNAFVECVAHQPHSFSGSIGSWASGLLFDNVHIDGNALRLTNLEIWNQGVGWNAANSMVWQSRASVLEIRQPPTATNWTTGVWGQFIGDGQWIQTSEFAHPDSLYRAQLADRLGASALAALEAKPRPAETGIASLEEVLPDIEERLAAQETDPFRDFTQRNGWLAADNRLLIGTQRPLGWWRGSVLPARAATYQSAITRFAPGMTGRGLTDDLAVLTDQMLESGEVSVRHHYGLWYDRRRDDHEMTRRIDGDVWPPFFELPWARSGTGTTWNGLSDYDLTRFNPWYFGRLREFAGLGAQKGLVLINEMYFQHNILESGGHWVDFPWRPENAVQETGFPEPPPFDGDTLIMADHFYDTTHPVRRDLHRRYIRECLEQLSGYPNVIHTVSAEFTGPLEFVEFWIDVIREWEKETGKDALIALSTTKDVQDAILEDTERGPVIDIIDFTYWHVSAEGELYAPKGGLNLAPRQHQRRSEIGRPSAESIASMVHSYRTAYPDKAVISSLSAADGWRFVAAGGSLPDLPKTTDPELLAGLVSMRPVENLPPGQHVLKAEDGSHFVVANAGRPVSVDLGNWSGTEFSLHAISPEDGTATMQESFKAPTSAFVHMPSGESGLIILWIKREP
jgi:hypothetical protein